MCFGGLAGSYGQLGTVFSSYESVSSCDQASCIPVSSAGFIAFSKTDAVVTQIAASMLHTCVVFADGATLCFGAGSNGRLGSDSTTSIAGSSGVPLASQGDITLPDAGETASVTVANSSTCVVRCSGLVFCFGTGFGGQLASGFSTDYGLSAGDMAAIDSIAFPAAITSNLKPGCATLMTFVAASAPITGFSPYKTLYVVAVPASQDSFSFESISTYPVTAGVVVSGLPIGTVFPLSTFGEATSVSYIDFLLYHLT